MVNKVIRLINVSFFMVFAWVLSAIPTISFAQQYEWSTIEDFPGLRRDDAIAFVINDYIYVGTGNHGGFTESNRFYRYSVISKVWKEVAAFPGSARQYARSEAVLGKGYLMGGIDRYGNPQNDIWEYDPVKDLWIEKKTFPAAKRWQAASFVIGGLIYYGTGRDWDIIYNDFWQYDPLNDEWKELSGMPKLPVYESVSFSIYGKGYIGVGRDCTGVYLNDFWSYNPVSDVWLQENDFPGDPRYYAKGETYGGQGFVGTGQNEAGEMLNDIWQFNPILEKWEKGIAIEGLGRRGLASCSVPFYGMYLVCGLDADFNRLNKVLNLRPIKEESAFKVITYSNAERILVTNLSESVLLSVYALDGQLVYSEDVIGESTQVSTNGWSRGVYILTVGNATKKITIGFK